MGAPLGVGALYIRRSRLAEIDPDPGHGATVSPGAEGRIHTGTVDMAAQLTVPHALAFQAAIGTPARAARLRWLRDRWAEPLRSLEGLEILTPSDPTLHAGITAFRVRGRTSAEDNAAVAAALLGEFGIFTVHRVGVAKGACVRVCPGCSPRPSRSTSWSGRCASSSRGWRPSVQRARGLSRLPWPPPTPSPKPRSG
jgi:selenocysteine lyase/cysteine desulfurase